MKRHLFAVPAIVAAVLWAYTNTLRNGFIGDDHIYIESNAFVQNTANLRLMAHPRFYLEAHEILSGNRPVFLASLLADHALYGNHPAGYHLTNALIHAANSVWVYGVASSLGLAGAAPVWAGLFFALHPVQSEAVDGISNRTDLLAAFFVFFSLWLFLRSRDKSRRNAAIWIAASSAAFGFALLSKEIAVTLPILIGLVELYFPIEKDRRFRLALTFSLMFVIGAAWAGFWAERFSYQGLESSSTIGAAVERFASGMPTVPGPQTEQVHDRIEKAHLFLSSSWEWSALYTDRKAWLLTSIKTLAGYFRLMAFPYPLIAERAPVAAHSLFDWRVLLSILTLLGIAYYAAAYRQKDAVSAFGAAWCLVALIPVSNLIPLYNPAAERYVYLATTGAALAAGSAIAWLLSRRNLDPRWTLIAAGAVAVTFGIRTQIRNRDWRNEKTLYLDAAVPGASQNSRVRLVRAALLQQEGRLDDSLREYQSTVSQRPDFAEAWLGLATAEASAGNVPQAQASFEKAISLSPANPSMRFTYGIYLADTGQKAKAVELYREALRLEPRFVEAWVNLGALYRDQGKFREARDCYLKAVALAAPHDPMPYYSFATMLEKSGDKKDAAAQYQAALDRDPSFTPARARLAKLQPLAKTH